MIDVVSKIVRVSLSLCESIGSQLQCSIQKVFKVVLIFNVKAGKTKVACHCHRPATGLIFLLVVLLVGLLVLFFSFVSC